MQSLLLTSILVATLALPIVASRDRLPRRGLRRALLAMLAFELFYLFACIVIYPRIA